MSLAPGEKLGPYEIVGKIGEGGMGEVYRARDASLGRDVALKVLPEAMAADRERVSRFRREAKLLAALTHQNIAAIHGFDEDGGRHFLAMEMVEGEPLDVRLHQGALEITTALEVARQVAEGLEAAHAKGIVHRDLKPGNVIVRHDAQVKILDFGLAKALVDEVESASALGQSPTLLTAETGHGVLLGTAAYMSPEQARGKPVDARSDNWAFGALLFEMLTGKRAFGGETVSDCLASVLQGEPDWAALPTETPPAVRLLLRRCLTKDARRRLHAIADARIELESVLSDPAGSTAMLAADAMQDATGRVRSGWGGAAVVGFALLAAVVAAAAAWSLRAPEVVEKKVERFILTLEDPELGRGQELSQTPDGRFLAYMRERTDRLAVLSFETAEIKSLPGIDRAFGAVYSPDGESIVFVDRAEDHLCRAPARGGPVTVLLESLRFVGGIVVAADGGIFASLASAPPALLHHLPAGSEEAEVVAAFADIEVFTPALSHDGSVLFVATRPIGAGLSPPVPESCTIEALRLADNRRVTVIQGATKPKWSPSGHVVAVGSGGALTAVPFDLDELRVTGDPVVVERPVRLADGWNPTYSLAVDGSLVYQTPAAERREHALTWLGAGGDVVPVDLPPELAAFDVARLSPDGTRLVLIENSVDVDGLWVHDLERGTTRRHGDRKVEWDHPVWSADGKQIMATLEPQDLAQPMSIWRFSVDSSAPPEQLLKASRHLTPLEVTNDGRFLVFGSVNDGSGEGNIQLLDLETLETSELVPALGWFIRGRLSPDGRFLAYSWLTKGAAWAAVRPFPGPGPPVLLSSAGQAEVTAWSEDSKGVVYSEGDLGTGRVLRADLRFEPELELLETTTLVEERADVRDVADYDSANRRLLWLGDAEEDPDAFLLVRNFDEHLRRVAPPSR